MGFWDIVVLIAVGALVGWIASMIFGTKKGLIGYILLGIAGGFVGGWLLRLIGINSSGTFLGNLIVGVIGAVLLLFIIQFIKKKR